MHIFLNHTLVFIFYAYEKRWNTDSDVYIQVKQIFKKGHAFQFSPKTFHLVFDLSYLK